MIDILNLRGYIPEPDKNGFKLVGSNKGFDIYFHAKSQTYSVYKDNKFLIGGKTKYSEVKSYLD